MKKTRIMYIEGQVRRAHRPGPHWTGDLFKTGKSTYYRGQLFHSLKGSGFKANFFDAETGQEFWISGCKKNGQDQLYSGTIEIDDDVREEYWRIIRKRPEMIGKKSMRDAAKYSH